MKIKHQNLWDAVKQCLEGIYSIKYIYKKRKNDLKSVIEVSNLRRAN